MEIFLIDNTIYLLLYTMWLTITSWMITEAFLWME